MCLRNFDAKLTNLIEIPACLEHKYHADFCYKNNSVSMFARIVLRARRVPPLPAETAGRGFSSTLSDDLPGRRIPEEKAIRKYGFCEEYVVPLAKFQRKTWITYKTHTLANGLTVVVNRDRSSKLAAVNLLYKVGARNENPARTGFAHLFRAPDVPRNARGPRLRHPRFRWRPARTTPSPTTTTRIST